MLAETRPYERIVAQALAHTVNGVVITDARVAGNPIVHVNVGFTRLTGYSAEEVIGRNCKFLQGAETAQPEVQELRRAIQAGEPTVVVIHNFRKDGTPFWNQVELSPVHDEDTGELTHFFALQTDVSNQRQVERTNALRALELERMFRGGPLGMVLFNENQELTLVTPATWRLLGISPQAVQGLSPSVWLARMARAIGCAPEALRCPAPQQHIAWELQVDGQRRVVDVSNFDLGSMARERILVLRDITREEADHTVRSQFLATAAHELRTPLGSIAGFTELLLMRPYSAEQAKPLLETVLRHAMRLSALLNDLLDLSQMDAMGEQAFAPVAVDLGDVMRKAVQIALPPQSKRSIELSLPPAGTRVLGHAQKLEQVLINLLSNALKYSPGGGTVTLQAQVESDGAHARLDVIDQGMGLSPEQQERLFTRFFRANPQGPIPGTGLGLVIVKELVERMGGSIHVRSALGQGSTFSVRLALSGDAS